MARTQTIAPTPTHARPPMPRGRRIVKAVLRPYMRLFHRLELQGAELIPLDGPLIVVLNHASLLDVPALMVLDPLPTTMTIAKASLFKVPIVRWFLEQWDAVPVERQGRDSSGVRKVLQHLRSGGVLAVAAEGRRTRDGHLQRINPVLARIVAGADVPILPLGISGSYEALPPGAILPRPHKIVVRAGPTFRLPRGTDGAAAAERIRRELAALLPERMQPVD